MTELPACPECDSTHVTNRTDHPGGVRRGNTEHKHRCEKCGETFDEPNFREPKHEGATIGLSGAAKQLAEMEPDELGDDPRPAD